MCGIVGLVSAEGRVDSGLLIRMRDRMIHRGPDEEGVWVSPDGRCGLGSRRLSIIDVDSGHQPMANQSGSVVLSYNGELYNHEALRAELEAGGRRFSTRSDTEALVAAYERWGEDCLERLDGMFAFTLWDAHRETLFFARDRLGKKPLYYTQTRDGWALASEIKALLVHPDVRRAVDPEALSHYLSFLVAPAPSTLFQGISKLPAAHCGTWSPSGGLRVRRWWDLPPDIDEDIGFAEAADRVRRLFAEAVRKRMMSDVPFGVYLSGGVDSTANVAMMCRYTDQPIRTFSVAFADEPSLDELSHARAVSQHFGTEHREIVVNDRMVMDSLPDLIHYQDEPIADPVCVPLLHLSRLTKQSGVTVVQIGEGSDEIFRGYPAYDKVFQHVAPLGRLERMVPSRLLTGALVTGGRFVGGLRHEYMLEAVRRGVPPAHGVLGFSERDKRRLLGSANRVATAHEYLFTHFGSARRLDEVANISLRHELQLRLSELLLMRVDKMTMAASVEARAPFLDHRLVEFAARLPIGMHWRPGAGKLVLKAALAGIVPQAVLARPKQGFGAPVWRWMKSLRAVAERELFRDPITAYLDAGAMRKLLDGPATTRRGFELWVLLNFALWHRHWIEGEDLDEVRSIAVAQVSS